jgi:hypothetical protein
LTCDGCQSHHFGQEWEAQLQFDRCDWARWYMLRDVKWYRLWMSQYSRDSTEVNPRAPIIFGSFECVRQPSRKSSGVVYSKWRSCVLCLHMKCFLAAPEWWCSSGVEDQITVERQSSRESSTKVHHREGRPAGMRNKLLRPKQTLRPPVCK